MVEVEIELELERIHAQAHAARARIVTAVSDGVIEGYDIPPGSTISTTVGAVAVVISETIGAYNTSRFASAYCVSADGELVDILRYGAVHDKGSPYESRLRWDNVMRDVLDAIQEHRPPEPVAEPSVLSPQQPESLDTVRVGTWETLTRDESPIRAAERVLSDAPRHMQIEACKVAYRRAKQTLRDRRYYVVETTWQSQNNNLITARVPSGTDAAAHRDEVRRLLADMDQWVIDAIPDAKAQIRAQDRFFREISEADRRMERDIIPEPSRSGPPAFCDAGEACHGNRRGELTLVLDGTGTQGWVCPSCVPVAETLDFGESGV